MTQHAEARDARGFSPATLSATLRAVAGFASPGEVDAAAGIASGTTRLIERGERCSCTTAPVLRFLLGKAGAVWRPVMRGTS